METVDKATAFIAKCVDTLEDGSHKEFYTKVNEGLLNAKELANNEEKTAFLVDAAVKYANQIAFLLFRQGALSDEMAEELRSFPTPESTANDVRKHTDERDARIANVNEAHQVILNEQKDLDIFISVVAGKTVEQAQKEMEEYEAQIKQMAQQR